MVDPIDPAEGAAPPASIERKVEDKMYQISEMCCHAMTTSQVAKDTGMSSRSVIRQVELGRMKGRDISLPGAERRSFTFPDDTVESYFSEKELDPTKYQPNVFIPKEGRPKNQSPLKAVRDDGDLDWMKR